MRVIKDRKNKEKRILVNSEGKVCFPLKSSKLERVISNWKVGIEIPDELFKIVYNKDKFNIIDIDNKMFDETEYILDTEYNPKIKEWFIFKGFETFDCDVEPIYTEKIIYKTHQIKYIYRKPLWLNIEEAKWVENYIKINDELETKEMALYEPAKYNIKSIKKIVKNKIKFVPVKGYDILHDFGYYTISGYDEDYFIENGNRNLVPLYAFEFDGVVKVTLLPNNKNFKEEYKKIKREIENLPNKLIGGEKEFDVLAEKVGAFKKYDYQLKKDVWYISNYVPESEDGYRGERYLDKFLTIEMLAKLAMKEEYETKLKKLEENLSNLIKSNKKEIILLDLKGASFI